MEQLHDFHFLRPLWLLALIPATFFLIKLLGNFRSSSQWQGLIDPHLLPHLLEGTTTPARRMPLVALFVLWVLASIALAGPTWEKAPQPVEKKVDAQVILWDLSPSMVAEDVSPSRLVRSRLKIIDLLNAKKEGLVGLVVYSGEAHVVTPLTDDMDTIVNLLSGLSPSMMPVRGSNPEMAMELAFKLLDEANVPKGDILLFTDGIDQGAEEELEDLGRQSAHQIIIWGIGSNEGAPIPLGSGGFARNTQGEIVVARLDEALLSDIASDMGGLYVPFTANDMDIKTIQRYSGTQLSSLTRSTKRDFDQWVEQGPLLLLLLLPFAAFAFRRGWVLSLSGVLYVSLVSGVLSAVLLPTSAMAANSLEAPQTQNFNSGSAQAKQSAPNIDENASGQNSKLGQTWEALWSNRKQRALKRFNEGEHEKAATLFEDPSWKGAAHYKANNFDKALENFEQEEDPQGLYNSANALTHMGKYDEAIKQYEQALAKRENYEDAQHNLDIAKQLKKLQEQAQQQQNQDQQNQDQQNKDQQNQGDKQQSKNQQGSQQNSDQQQNKDQQGQQQDQGQNSDQQNQQAQNDNSNLSEEQKEALDQKYNQGTPKDEQEAQEQKEQQQAAKGEQQDENKEGEEKKEQQSLAQQQKEKAQGDKENNEQQQAQQVAQMQQRKAKSEKQQALDQWLRKVPDDPSGLLRNKFEHQAQQRRREYRSGTWKPPGNNATSRW